MIPNEIEGQLVNKSRLLSGAFDGPFTINRVPGLFVRMDEDGVPEVKSRQELGIPKKVGSMELPQVQQLKLINEKETGLLFTKDHGQYFSFRLRLRPEGVACVKRTPLSLNDVQQHKRSTLEGIQERFSSQEAKANLERIGHLLNPTELRIFTHEIRKVKEQKKLGQVSQLRLAPSSSKSRVALSSATREGYKEAIRQQLIEEQPKEEKKEKQQVHGKRPGLGRGRSNPRF